MKKMKFWMLATTALVLSACSAGSDVAEEPKAQTLEEGFLALNIQLPTDPVSRAANDDFSDGEAEEYKVQDCALLLFQGADEASATLMNAQILQLPATTSTPDNKVVTTSYASVAKIKGFNTTNNLYALAMINYKNVMSIASNGMPTIGGVTLSETSTLSDVRNITTDVDLTVKGGTRDYFFMTNAVMSSVPGGTSGTTPAADKLYQLVALNKDNIKQTEDDALGAKAGDVLVERAVAKATLKVSAETIESLGATDGKIASATWAIDNTEPKTYVARNIGDGAFAAYSSAGITGGNYRFVGTTSVKDVVTEASDAFRTYWGTDPQYDKDEPMGLVGATAFGNAGDDKPQYCYENTFDVLRQNYTNTTRAIIKVQLTKTDEFFTVNSVQDKLTKEGAEAYAIENVVTNTDIVAAFKAANAANTVEAADFTATYERNATTGLYEMKTLALTAAGTGKGVTLSATVLAAAVEKVNDEVVIRDYQDGVVYYEARFQHMANNVDANKDLAPWNTWEADPKPAAGSTELAYPGETTREANYLGRYGVLRNNWYAVDVTTIKRLGYPANPAGQVNNKVFADPKTPDDNLESYLSANIHVLSWAKRMQSWTF